MTERIGIAHLKAELYGVRRHRAGAVLLEVSVPYLLWSLRQEPC